MAKGGVGASGDRSGGEEDAATCGASKQCRHIRCGGVRQREVGDTHFFFGQSAQGVRCIVNPEVRSNRPFWSAWAGRGD